MRTSTIAGIVAAVIVALGIVEIVRPVSRPALALRIPHTAHVSGPPLRLPWPSGVQAEVAVTGVGQSAQHGPAGPRPIGSMAKMMTAYLVLKAHPLGLYANGPTLIVTPRDAAIYQSDAATSQSVYPVKAGERLSERTLLEALLVPSGNNIATMLAEWVGGSVSRFTAEMNATAKSLGLTQTHYHGPVGLNPETDSTAQDELHLAMILMKNPVFRQIVAMPQMPVLGTGKITYNYNYLLGHDGVIGVKTGSTTDSGGCVVLARNVSIGSKTVTEYAAVLGQPATPSQPSQLWGALDDAKALVDSLAHSIKETTLVSPDTVIGRLTVPWQHAVPLIATRAVRLLAWPGLSYSLSTRIHVPTATSVPAHTIVGTLTVRLGNQTATVPVETATAIVPPSLKYRLLR
ncbi:MAG: D-alanyl-D-alanine carboxypeptidase [Firmicutes bacterium]|nr:D-alanyl-D-alanine carboxypeptidase [Bacillota bacterium]